MYSLGVKRQTSVTVDESEIETHIVVKLSATWLEVVK